MRSVGKTADGYRLVVDEGYPGASGYTLVHPADAERCPWCLNNGFFDKLPPEAMSPPAPKLLKHVSHPVSVRILHPNGRLDSAAFTVCESNPVFKDELEAAAFIQEWGFEGHEYVTVPA